MRNGYTYNNGLLPAQLAMLDEVRYFGLTAASRWNFYAARAGSGTLQSHKNRIALIKQKIEALPVASALGWISR